MGSSAPPPRRMCQRSPSHRIVNAAHVVPSVHEPATKRWLFFAAAACPVCFQYFAACRFHLNPSCVERRGSHFLPRRFWSGGRSANPTVRFGNNLKSLCRIAHVFRLFNHSGSISHHHDFVNKNFHRTGGESARTSASGAVPSTEAHPGAQRVCFSGTEHVVTDALTRDDSTGKLRTRRWSTTGLVLFSYCTLGCQWFCCFVHTLGLFAGLWISCC